MTILLDRGHGKNTAGKCAPDKSLFEWKYCLEIVELLKTKLEESGHNVKLVTPEDEDISLKTRCLRINEAYAKDKQSFLISVHLNAAGNGANWMNARGWSGWVYTKASLKSKTLALILYKHAEKAGLKGNRSVPKEKYWSANFYILKNTNCPAVLTENLFLDNKDDVAYLKSDEGKKTIVDIHYKAILEYTDLL